MYYIGIDLAWTYKNETGFCVIDDNLNCIFNEARIYSDEKLVELIMTYQPSIVSVDAPLEVKNEQGSRVCDSLVMKHKIYDRYLKLFATSRSYMLRTFKAIRGESIYRLLKEEGYNLGMNLTETYPTGIFLSLMPELFDNKYKLSSKLSLQLILEHANAVLNALKKMGIKNILIDLDNITTKKAYKHVEDQIDGLLCAVNSYYFHQKKVKIFEADDNGYISLPTR